MTKKELIEKLSTFDDNAEIVTFNRTSNRWFKTGCSSNYPILTVAETKERVGEYGKRQLEKFAETDITLFF